MTLTRQFDLSGSGAFAQAIEFGRPPIVGFFGDSIADFAGGTQSANTASTAYMDGISPFFWALAEGHYGDCLIDSRSNANGGYNFGVGGTSSTDLLTNQIGQLVAKSVKPDIAYVQTAQNDSMTTLANAQTFAANVTSFTTQALAAGVKLVIICPVPPKSGTASTPKAKDAFNRILERFAIVTPGVVFLNYLPYVADPAGITSTTTVAWRGTTGAASGYSSDGTHPSSLACRAIAQKVLTPILQRVMRPLVPRACISSLYDSPTHPDGNVLGKNGMFQGTGGQYNGANNAGVAGVSQANGDRWTVSDNNGVVVTPTLSTDADGFVVQRLTFSGTASADAQIDLNHNFIFDVASSQYTMEGVFNFNAMAGLWGFKLAGGGGTLDAGITYNSVMETPLTKLFYLRSRRASTFTNSGFATKTFKASFTFKSGTSPTGFVDVSRCGIFRES